jgi:PEGA domain
MSATPSIVIGASTGYVYDSNTMVLMCLYENKAALGYTSGVVKFQGSKHDMAANACFQDLSPSDIDVHCAKTTAYNLKNIAYPVVYGQGLFDFGCIESFGCAGGDVCGSYPLFQDTCTTWGARVSFETDIPIRARNTSSPLAPTGLTITPGSGTLTLVWNSVNDPTGGEVFAYNVLVFDGTTTVIDGYTEAGLRNVTIGGLTNGKVYSVQVWALSHNGYTSFSAAMGSGTPVGATKPGIYALMTTPTSPAAGASFTIKAQIANSGPSGKVRAVFKVGGTQISDQNSTLNTFPGGGLWEPTIAYTMPNATITITVDAYGWDGTAWVKDPARTDQTLSITRTPSAVSCTNVSIDPFTAITVTAGEKVTFKATVIPATTAFDVAFKDRAGTVLGTCRTSGGVCTFIWDSTGKTAGATYYVKATVAQGLCNSTETSITVLPAINQWNVNIYVRDTVTNAPVGAATVVINAQSKQTDAAGYVQFRVTEGTIDITISKTGYNTFTTAESVFSDKTVNYPLSPVGAVKGNIQFVSVPSNAEIFIDGADQGVKTPFTVTDLPVGIHTFALKLAGYNDTAGSVTVAGGSTIQVYAELSPSTPTTGSLYIASVPGEAEIFIDGADQGVKTPSTITNLTPGSHTVKLTKTGYTDFTGSVTITAGTTSYLSATLTILPGIGTLEISSVPAGARVFIDGADAQKVTPATITNLSSGDHTYKLVLSGYKDATGTSTIEPGMTTTVSVPLTKAEAKVGAGTILGISLLGLGVLGAVVVATREKKYSPPQGGFK